MMNKKPLRIATMLLSLVSLAASAKSELQSYVEQCESELGFNASNVKPMNCNNGAVFNNGAPGSPVNDYFVYQRVNDQVDLAVACRWLDNQLGGTSVGAASVELIIHNRQNAKTCFFSAKDGPLLAGDQPVSVAIVSPTNFPDADSYWLQPTDLNNKQLASSGVSGSNKPPPSSGFTQPVQCVGCHSAGPYIASEDIAPYLAQFGLLNNGHDTVADATNPNTISKLYHAVGSGLYNLPLRSDVSAFGAWDSIIYKNLHGRNDTLGVKVDPQNECSTGCHSIAYNSTIGDLSPVNDRIFSLLPPIYAEIFILDSNGVMPPTNDLHSNYRWINRDTPNGSGEYELLSDMRNEYPRLVCDNATELQAHVVGSTDIFSTADPIPDHLHTFNLQDGLECRNSGQECAGHRVKREEGRCVPLDCSRQIKRNISNKIAPSDFHLLLAALFY
ncbi:MAG: hypothetical protein ABUL58_02450 [Steroidobacter sp.]